MRAKISRGWMYGLGAAAMAAAVGAAVVLRRPAVETAREGFPAPSFSFVDLSGRPATLSEYKGRVVLLDFWATWCEACQDELPALKRIDAQYRGRGFELLAASVDEDGRKALLPYVAQNAIPWRVVLANADGVEKYSVFGLPTKFLIDREGVIARSYVGEVEPQAVEEDIKTLLKGRNS